MPGMVIPTFFRAKSAVSRVMKRDTRAVQVFGRRSSAAFNRASRGAGRFRKAIKGAIAFFSVRQVLRWSNESIKAYQKQEQALANVRAGIKATGGVAGKTFKELTKEASALQKNTFFGDEDILQGVTAQMLTFTNITGKTFNRAQKAVLDVTAKLRGLEAGETDLRATTIMLSKALNDPVANLGALGRAGIQFSDEQKTMIKTLSTTGKTAEAQAMILSELEKQYGGTAEALAKTSGGVEKSLKNQIGDAMEVLGKSIAPVKLQLLKMLQVLVPFIPTLVKIAAVVVPLILAWKAYQKIMLAVNAVQTIFNVIMAANPIGLVVLGVMALIAIFVVLVKKWDTVKRALIKGALAIKNFFIRIWEAIKRGFIMAFDVVKKVFFTFVDYFLVIYGTMAKVILAGAIKIGTLLGKDVSGLEKVVDKINQVQSTVRDKSYFGDFQKRQAPNQGQAAAQNGRFQADVNFNNLPSGATVNQKKSGAQPINMNFVGAN